MADIAHSLYHVELDLPQTGIHTMEDQVPLPYFHAPRGEDSTAADERSHYQYHFLAMVALRRLIARIHGSIHGSKPRFVFNRYGKTPEADHI